MKVNLFVILEIKIKQLFIIFKKINELIQPYAETDVNYIIFLMIIKVLRSTANQFIWKLKNPAL